MNNELDREFEGRITQLETKGEQFEKDIERHEILLEEFRKDIASLVTEIKGIRTAIWFMAASIVANVPALGNLLSYLKSFLG